MKSFYIKILFLVGIIFISSCSDDKKLSDYYPPANSQSVKTGELDEEFGIIARIDNNVITTNGVGNYQAGICYSSVNNDPKLLDNNNDINGDIEYTKEYYITSDNFNSLLKNLEKSTKYYFRSYSLSANGIVYGDVKEFTTGDGNNMPLETTRFESEFFNDEWSQEIGVVTKYGYYKAIALYEDGYDIDIFVNDGGSITVPAQPAWENATYGVVSVEGSGTMVDKVMTLKLRHFVSAGSFAPNPATEVITFQ